ncbi:piggyBac transposable element-derived protein 2-like [Lepeophtheirus salmonis]|uniref:piggyBac transposable element-derived protein 2-like n=1 Tax=Lepeophtheirus salmonis TaxID=72036 RepID=UPI001AE5BEBF|nr:piggyBac transposable element-derived protein 2-like [Lepeophtheirus salmonis]
MERKFGKCFSTVLHLLSLYSDEKTQLPYNYFFDNLFTFLPLLNELQRRGCEATGTLRANRHNKLCPIRSPKDFDKLSRGTYGAVTGNTDTSQIRITRWKTNIIVTAASTNLGENPAGIVKRWSKVFKKHIQVKIPHVIKQYNEYMGGTDRMDQNINAYRIGIKGGKWWGPIFTWLVDAAVQNAWILARDAGQNLDQLSFTREIVISYLLKYQCCPRTIGRKPLLKLGENEARYDQVGHFVEPVPNGGRRRCSLENCNSR